MFRASALLLLHMSWGPDGSPRAIDLARSPDRLIETLTNSKRFEGPGTVPGPFHLRAPAAHSASGLAAPTLALRDARRRGGTEMLAELTPTAITGRERVAGQGVGSLSTRSTGRLRPSNIARPSSARRRTPAPVPDAVDRCTCTRRPDLEALVEGGLPARESLERRTGRRAGRLGARRAQRRRASSRR